jgi:hypothetical protein
LLLIPLLAALASGANGQHMGAASPRFASGFNRGSYHRSFFAPSFIVPRPAASPWKSGASAPRKEHF